MDSRYAMDTKVESEVGGGLEDEALCPTDVVSIEA